MYEHAGLYSDPDFMNTIITGDESWVYGYDPGTKSFHKFPYNEYPTRVLNTLNQMLLAIKLTLLTGGSMKVQCRLMQARFIEIHKVFDSKKKG